MKQFMKKFKWAALATLAYVGGASISLIKSSMMIDKGTNPTDLGAMLTSFLIWGLLVAGIGQLMMAVAHGTSNRFTNFIDGLGKVFAVFGWSLGVVGTIMFAMEGTEADAGLINSMVLCVFILPVAIWAVIAITYKVKNR